jgi:hypothetical protein
MTATAPVDSAPSRIPQAAPGWHEGIVPGKDRRSFLIAMSAVLLIFLMLQNRYWVPGGDSEVYTGAARNIVQGQGNTFNGVPVIMVPPGWAYVMAGLMKISPTFLLLKLVTMGFMAGSLAVMYWICRRFASPKTCAAAIILTALVSHVYSLTFWLHSDALFCLISSLGLLLAMQISENRSTWWRIALLMVCCAVMVMVRWAGLLSWLLIGATLLRGELWPRVNRRWVLAVITGVVTMGVFLSIRAALRVTPEMAREISLAGAGGEGDAASDIADAAAAGRDLTLAVEYRWFNPAAGGLTGYVVRLAGWGHWFSYLLWQPFRVGGPVTLISLFAGWTTLLTLITLAVDSARARQWLWPALLVYSLGLALNWTHPVARYLVPVTPLIIVGVMIGLPRLLMRHRLGWAFAIYAAALILGWNGSARPLVLVMRPLAVIVFFGLVYLLTRRWIAAAPATSRWSLNRKLLAFFVATVVLCNAALWAVDVYVARSSDFYQRYEAGLNQDLIAGARWLRDQPLKDKQIAVSRRYVNMGRRKTDSQLGIRVSTMLIDKAIAPVPDRYVKGGDPRKNINFLNWARSLQPPIEYVLYQPDVSPWRIFHFRMGWLQQLQTGSPPENTGAGWRLYYIPPEGDEAQRVSLTPQGGWPTRVPGL